MHQVRGSATLLSGVAVNADLEGQVIATAAHVLFDLEQGRPWRACAFHYLGLGELPGYRVPIDDAFILKGGFDPALDVSSVESGKGDWAFIWLGANWHPPLGPAGLQPLANGAVPSKDSGEFGLLAWNSSAGEMSVSLPCQAVESQDSDLGGGAWAGQWLDDCDSMGGASGGGLIFSASGTHSLVAIRGGQHWDYTRWPLASHPDGPPRGERWDPEGFTNYARVIDVGMLNELQQWILQLAKSGDAGGIGSHGQGTSP